MLAASYAFQDRLGRPCTGAYFIKEEVAGLWSSRATTASPSAQPLIFFLPTIFSVICYNARAETSKIFSNARELHLHYYYQFDVVSAIYVICMFSFLVCAVSPTLLGLASQAAPGHWSHRRRRLVKMCQGRTDAYVL